jgi:hypothetical protein
MFALNKTGLNLAKQLGTFQCRQGGSISVILLDQLEKKGKKGEIIKVKRGFARNFLVPRKLAGKFLCQSHRFEFYFLSSLCDRCKQNQICSAV